MKITVKPIHIILYTLIAVLIGLAYWNIRPMIINTQPGLQVISNLTVNYLAASFLTGALSGWWVYERLLKRAHMVWRLLGTVGFVLIVAIGWMILMSMGGYQIRWMR